MLSSNFHLKLKSAVRISADFHEQHNNNESAGNARKQAGMHFEFKILLGNLDLIPF